MSYGYADGNEFKYSMETISRACRMGFHLRTRFYYTGYEIIICRNGKALKCCSNTQDVNDYLDVYEEVKGEVTDEDS